MKRLMTGAAMAAALTGCGIAELAPVERIMVDAGEGQSAVAGALLDDPIVARTFREDGTTAAWLLHVQLLDGGAIDLGEAQAAGVGATVQSPDRDVTTVRWTLGDTPGEQRLRFFAVPSRGDTIEAIVTAQALTPQR